MVFGLNTKAVSWTFLSSLCSVSPSLWTLPLFKTPKKTLPLSQSLRFRFRFRCRPRLTTPYDDVPPAPITERSFSTTRRLNPASAQVRFRFRFRFRFPTLTTQIPYLLFSFIPIVLDPRFSLLLRLQYFWLIEIVGV